jgi:hypothetical protein
MPVDADLLHRCVDPSIPPAIAETFVTVAGSNDPLGITVREGSRIVLVPPAKTPDEALMTIRAYVGRAVVRVGVTQYPVGVDIKDPSEISPDLFDACFNLQQGTALFGKVWRVVLQWYGNPTDESVMPQVLDDAIEAWKTGRFEGASVFSARDPGPPEIRKVEDDAQQPISREPLEATDQKLVAPPNEAGIRINLSGIGVRAP